MKFYTTFKQSGRTELSARTEFNSAVRNSTGTNPDILMIHLFTKRGVVVTWDHPKKVKLPTNFQTRA